MRYFYVEPEVAGGLGDHTIFGVRHPFPIVAKLHYSFDGWLGDALLTSFPCFIVTEEARRRFEESGITGMRYDDVKINASDRFHEMHPDQQLPRFFWMKIEGRAGREDFGLAPDHRLIASQRALDILRPLGLNHASIEPADV